MCEPTFETAEALVNEGQSPTVVVSDNGGRHLRECLPETGGVPSAA
jgi:hypothetical protein